MSYADADDFRAFLAQQRKRIHAVSANAIARTRRRIADLEPRPLIEARGLPQAWHRDTPDQQRFSEDDI